MSGSWKAAPPLLQTRELIIPCYPEYARKRGLERSRFWHQWLLQKLDYLFRNRNLPRKPRVVDLGAGGCVISACLARAGAKIECVDNWNEYSNDELHGEGLAFGDADELLDAMKTAGLSIINHDLAQHPWPLQNRRYDVVTLFDVIEHIWHGHGVMATVREIRRICKPGALVCITTPNVAMLKNRLKALAGKSIYHDLERWLNSQPYTGHVREFTLDEIRHIFEMEGFGMVGQWVTNSMLWKHKQPDGTWKSGIPLSTYGLALALYCALTAPFRRWRHTFLSAFIAK